MKGRGRSSWYGVFAVNGFGIYSDYGKLLVDKKYIRSARLKSFESRRETEEFVEEGIISLKGYDYIKDVLPETYKTNHFYFLKSNKI